MAQKEEMGASRYSAAQLELMAIEAENEVKRLRGEPVSNRNGEDKMETEEDKAKKVEKEEARVEQRKEKLLAKAEAAIKLGADPRDVGAFLLGIPALPQVAQPQQVNGGIRDIDDVIKIVKLMTDERGSSRIENMIEKLNDKIDKVAKERDDEKKSKRELEPPDPLAEITRWRKMLIDTGFVIDPKSIPRTTGRSIEEIREENNHKLEEKKLAIREKELDIEREYKIGQINTMADLTENLGRGIGHEILTRVRPGEEETTVQKKSNLQSFKCQEVKCGFTFQVPIGQKVIVCPKCGTKYALDIPADTSGVPI